MQSGMRGEDTRPPLVQPSWINGFRSEGFPTQYAEHKTAASVDVLEAGIVLAFVMLGTTFLVLIPSWRGLQKASLLIRITVSLVIGGILASTNFGQRWEVGDVHTMSPYKPGSASEVNVEVGMHIGLRAVNITLRALTQPGERHERDLKHEIIDYNEEFSWTWDQGRFGFGPFAGRLQRTFREGQRKGLPLPILWVADYFTLDGEGYRFGRFYRTAGWYAHIAMWSALPSWMMAVVLLHCAIPYGALLTCLTGLLQLLACLLWAAIRNPEPLFIPFEHGNLTTYFATDFWLTLVNGFVCVILGVVIYVMYINSGDALSVFFGIDPLTDYEECHLTPAEKKVYDEQVGGATARGEGTANQMEMGTGISVAETSDDSHLNVEPVTHVVLKRRTTLLHSRRSMMARARPLPPLPKRRAPSPAPEEDEQPIYGNLNDGQQNTAQGAQGFANRAYMHH